MNTNRRRGAAYYAERAADEEKAAAEVRSGSTPVGSLRDRMRQQAV